jgi:hypothetical protein
MVSQIHYAALQQQQPIIPSIRLGGFSLPSSTDELASPPVTYIPKTDPLKDRIIGI